MASGNMLGAAQMTESHTDHILADIKYTLIGEPTDRDIYYTIENGKLVARIWNNLLEKYSKPIEVHVTLGSIQNGT
jgi:hypothetical protein